MLYLFYLCAEFWQPPVLSILSIFSVHSDPGYFKILVPLAILCRGSFYSASHFELMQTRFNFYETFRETTSHNLPSSKSQYSTPLLLTSFPFYMYLCPKVYNFFYLSTMLSLQFFSSCIPFINIFQWLVELSCSKQSIRFHDPILIPVPVSAFTF
jgi:hypothetical protein